VKTTMLRLKLERFDVIVPNEESAEYSLKELNRIEVLEATVEVHNVSTLLKILSEFLIGNQPQAVYKEVDPKEVFRR
jgi:hypothetical protein